MFGLAIVTFNAFRTPVGSPERVAPRGSVEHGFVLDGRPVYTGRRFTRNLVGWANGRVPSASEPNTVDAASVFRVHSPDGFVSYD